ncbi:hypothetical protein [Streptomyces sp. NBC_01190]|uniref:hypothetical protein n=1 Tax=Streptomyces sp. NBC_01190 TaxID=2903767 RepID=UPI003867012C|nr:hypothetical protein OG519_14830 [Streptomyces sp. NBC_01190]
MSDLRPLAGSVADGLSNDLIVQRQIAGSSAPAAAVPSAPEASPTIGDPFSGTSSSATAAAPGAAPAPTRRTADAIPAREASTEAVGRARPAAAAAPDVPLVGFEQPVAAVEPKAGGTGGQPPAGTLPVQRSAVVPGGSALPVVQAVAVAAHAQLIPSAPGAPGGESAPPVVPVRRSTPVHGEVGSGASLTTSDPAPRPVGHKGAAVPGAAGPGHRPLTVAQSAPHHLPSVVRPLAPARTLTRNQPLLAAGAPRPPSGSRAVPLRGSASAPSQPLSRLTNHAAVADTARPSAPAGIPVQRLVAAPSTARGSGTAPAAGASRSVTLPNLHGRGVAAAPTAPPARAAGPGTYPPVVPQNLAPQNLVSQSLAPQDLVSQNTVQRSTDGVRFSPVPTAFPAGSRPVEPGAPSAYRRDLPVPLVAAAPVPPMVLPVQRTPATPSVADPAIGPHSPAHRADPWPPPAVLKRSGGGSGHSTGDPTGHRSGGGGGNVRRNSWSAGDGRNGPPSSARAATDPAAQRDSVPAVSGFDPRKLKDEQVDELTHKLIGPLTRMLRTELRLDRERIGRLRDPRR